MINLPKSCLVNRFIPKNKFYEKANIASKVKEEFVDKVERITWLYKISESTVGITKTEEVEEIQIFEIDLKEKVIPKNVINVITKSIPYKILFIFKYLDEKCYAIKLDVNYYTEWNEDIDFKFNGLNLEEVYRNIVKTIIKEEENTREF